MEKEHLEIILENMDSKFALVLECYTSLDQKIDRKFDELNEKIGFLDFKVDTVNENLGDKIDRVESSLGKKIDGVEKNLGEKIDTVATDLKAHRNDTEAHQIYQVKEGS